NASNSACWGKLDMNDARFEELIGRLLDGEPTPDELLELVELAKDHPNRQQELQSQLEIADMLAQSEDSLRASSLFVAAVQSRVGDDPFVHRIRSAISSADPSSRPQRQGLRHALWAISAVAVVAMASGLFLARSGEEPGIATIKGLHGALQWTGDGGQVELNLEKGQPLRGGTLESLSTDSWIEIEFRDGSRVTTSGQSVLTISERDQKELHLRQGQLSADVSPQPSGKPMLIYTPTAELEVLGTQFNVDARPAATVLTVNKGRVRATRLSDGSVTEVPANHQVTAAASRLAEFKAAPRLRSVTTWRGQLPQDAIYGTWTPESQSLRSAALLWRGCDGNHKQPTLLYLSALSVCRGEQSPVELRGGAKFRIRGRLDFPADVVIGLTTHHLKGGFAGKHRALRKAELFSPQGGEFDLLIPIEEFAPVEPPHPKSALGLGLQDWWSVTINVDAGLAITNVELIQAEPSSH
ncbi:MAG: FecR family protein, partial [Planctomycetales bacterium]